MSFIILDRDGVINYDSDEYIKTPNEWKPIPGSLEAIAQLNRQGFHVIIATNQSGIARGYYDFDTLDLIHEKLMKELASVGGYIEEIFFCPHHPEQHCHCRKPKPGLINQIQKKYPIKLTDTFLIGDSLTDIQAAQSAGCLPILVLTGKGKLTLQQCSDQQCLDQQSSGQQSSDLFQVPHFPDLARAVEYVLSQQRKKT